MADQFKIDGDGKCSACNSLSVRGEHVQCFACKDYFHAVCSSVNADTRVGTKTMVSLFLGTSTKRNFVFYCDKCLTELEIKSAESESARVDTLEKKMNNIDKQLEEIMKVLKDKTKDKQVEQVRAKNKEMKVDSIWDNKERLANVRAPEPKAVLVINKSDDTNKNIENHEIIEKAVMDNDISLSKSYENETGDLVLVCESQEARDKLKTAVEIAKQDITMSSPKTKFIPINIVGLTKSRKEDEIIPLIVNQNDYIKSFAAVNKIDDHIRVNAVKPLRNKPDVYQVFASVSPILREGISHHNNKVIIGLKSCKVYDKSLTRRCNNCQNLGHFVKDCPNSEEPCCGHCSGNHRSDNCGNKEQMKCINCVRNKEIKTDHSAFDYKCPAFKKYEQELSKGSLNWKRSKQIGAT